MRLRLLVMLALAAQTGFAAAAELKVLTTPALTEVWHELAPKFEAPGTSSPSCTHRPARSPSA